ncbi:response regulator transcription factor [Kribbella sandramycini]|uniref:DNA-binding NarL/FixJ family response regulator n=1 Tax=Kribbella sandramycini TaxID=60450 RepID=A0A7Y4P193_9ACTN|nr:response regulator transcription factor [Kribbella sandramycini]MBB6570881.1 DNA-binding NarL/FixJ family response regulator [Kribbella sandramycini]NOL44012.1 response regulator transcription factor [Kribbella sandramycini]
MRIVLAEDSTLLRAGLISLLREAGHDVAAAVGDGDALIAACAEHLPDVVIADVRMPPTFTSEGLQAALTIRQAHPGIGVLVLSQYVDKRYTGQLLDGEARGVGYLLKDRVVEVEDFLEALHRVAAGGTAFDPEVVRRLLNRARDTEALARLTSREYDVLELMAQGHTNDSIAARLYISRSAVEKHANAIFDKLRLNDADGFNRRALAIIRFLNA